jgi:hypothetical protein
MDNTYLFETDSHEYIPIYSISLSIDSAYNNFQHCEVTLTIPYSEWIIKWSNLHFNYNGALSFKKDMSKTLAVIDFKNNTETILYNSLISSCDNIMSNYSHREELEKNPLYFKNHSDDRLNITLMCDYYEKKNDIKVAKSIIRDRKIREILGE